jgi:hypothetical protein
VEWVFFQAFFQRWVRKEETEFELVGKEVQVSVKKNSQSPQIVEGYQ